MVNDINNNIEFAKEATEKFELIQSMIKDYIVKFDVLKLKLTYNKDENTNIKLGGGVEYNVIYPPTS